MDMKSSHSPKGEEKSHKLGHRQRLRDRFSERKDGAFPDYELLEMCLYYALPRGDTKPLAKTLLQRFGNLSGVLHADPAVLKSIKGVGNSVIMILDLMRALTIRCMQVDIMERTVLQSWQQVIDYCQVMMGHLQDEQFRVLFLDNKMQLITDELQQKGTINQVAIYPREILKQAITLGASGVILVHNHPSGDPMPSRDDIEMTLRIKDAGTNMGVEVHDHLIIGRGRHVSLKSMGII